MNPCTRLETHRGHFFPFSNKSCHLISFKICKKPSMTLTESEIKGSESIPDLTSQTDLHSLTLSKLACKGDCEIKSGRDSLPVWLGREQKVLGFSQIFKPIKWQDLLEEGNNSRNAFRTGAKINFSKKKMGLGTLLSTVILKICAVQINTLFASLQSLTFLGKKSSSRVLFMLVKMQINWLCKNRVTRHLVHLITEFFGQLMSFSSFCFLFALSMSCVCNISLTTST